MTDNLFDLTEQQYKLERKVTKLREKIKLRTLELGITPEHSAEGHFYRHAGSLYPSVTGRLKILKDPSIANWKMNRALDYIFQHFPEMTNENLMDHIFKAKLLPQTDFENAGDIGRQVHAWRERQFLSMIDAYATAFYSSQDDTTIDPMVISGIRGVAKFIEDTKYTPLACELAVADDKLQVGGTADDIGILDGKVAFIDLKTSNIGDKDAYFYQVALYVYMFEKLYKIRTQVHYILHVSKDNGTYKLIPIPDIRKRIKEAKHIVKLDIMLQNLREEKKKQPIVI